MYKQKEAAKGLTEYHHIPPVLSWTGHSERKGHASVIPMTTAVKQTCELAPACCKTWLTPQEDIESF